MPRTAKEKQTGKKTALTLDVFDQEGKVVDKISLPESIFGVKVNRQLIAQAVRVHHINLRQGTQSTKTRSTVSGTTRKMYRQKGTGRARHGDYKAPIFVGGGTAHGPHPRQFSAKLPKTMRKMALFSTLSDHVERNMITVVDKMDSIKGKTKDIVRVLSHLKLMSDQGKGQEKRLLIVVPESLVAIERAGRNIPFVSLMPARLLNAYDVACHESLLFLNDSFPVLKETFLHDMKEKAIQTSSVTKAKTIQSAQVSENKPEKIKKIVRVAKKETKTPLASGKKTRTARKKSV